MITKAHRLRRQALASTLVARAIVSTLLLLGARAEAGEDADAVFSLPIEDLMDFEIASATKYPVRIGDIPGTVIVVTRGEIEAMGYATLEEVLANVPGLYAIDTYEDLLLGVRGNLGGSVAFLVDGVLQHPTRIKGLSVPDRARLNVPVEAIERIEIVRGPQSVVYGSNAFFGSVNVVTRKEQGAGASAAYGTNDTSRLFARFARRSGEGHVAASVGRYASDGLGGAYADMMSPEQLARMDPRMHDGLDGDLEKEELAALVSAGYGGLHADLRYSRMDYGMFALTPSFDEGNRLELETWHGALGYSRDLTGRVVLDAQVLTSGERYDLDLDILTPAPSGGQVQESHRLEAEVTLRFLASPAFSVLGGYRHKTEGGIESSIRLPEFGISGDVTTGDVRTDDLFVLLQGSPGERLRATAGLRWSHVGGYRRTIEGNYAGATGLPRVTDYPADDRLDAQAGLVYDIDGHQSLKALYGSATQDNRAFLEPERISTWEVDYVALARRWSLTLGVFRNDIENIQRIVQDFNAGSGVYRRLADNSGALRTWGIEALLRFAPLAGLDLELGGTWQDTEDRNNPDKAVGYSPRLLATAKATWRHRSLTAGLAATHVGSMEADWQWSTEQPGAWHRIGDAVDAYTVVTANLRWDHRASGAYVNLHALNLLDAEVRYPANELVYFEKGSIGPGREFLATLGWNF